MGAKLLAAAVLVCGVLGGAAAQASCIGSDALKTCTDDAGNSYTITRFGNSTMMDGYNARTGSSWSQNSTTIGNTTFHDGMAANGNSWSMTDQRIGNMRYLSGTDSQGNPISTTCGPFGCD